MTCGPPTQRAQTAMLVSVLQKLGPEPFVVNPTSVVLTETHPRVLSEAAAAPPTASCGGILPTPNQLLPTVRVEKFEKASRSAGSIV